MHHDLNMLSILWAVVHLAIVATSSDSDTWATESYYDTPLMAARAPRILQEHQFVPLSCNRDNADDTSSSSSCRPWSSMFGKNQTHTERLVIPCGKCVFLDSSVPKLQLLDGIDIHGTLRVLEVPLVLETTVVVVQGILEMSATGKAVDGNPLIHITMIGGNEETFTPVHDNSNACGGGDCVAGKKSITVAGGQVKIFGLPRSTPTWVPLLDVAGGTMDEPNLLLVDDLTVLDTWAPGAEIFLTSHTREWNGHQVRRIVSVRRALTAPIGSVWIELDASIERPTTARESPDFAVNVALLSRNIVFEGGEDKTESHGGHFWITSTPHVAQTVMGVDIRNFGQQGTLGRYPVHFHYCGDVSGSVVTKNTIRESNQRCIVVHATDNLLVEGNVALSNAAHCFMLEDGIERGNQWIRNLGAATRSPIKVVPGGSDKEPSIFWISNPSNTYVGNIAAGSEGSGIWMELGVRGQHEYPGNPKRETLLLFKDNAAHSCFRRGVTTYPTGFLPDKVSIIQGLRVYLNAGTGLFLHRTKRINISQSIFADNDGPSIDIDRADAIRISNTSIIGVTGSSPCDADIDLVIGVELHTWKDDPYESGVTIEDVSFSGFVAAQHCKYSFPLSIDETVGSNSFEIPSFDLYTTLERVTVEEDVVPVDFCRADLRRIRDIYLLDLDGSLGPAGIPATSVATLVSSQQLMLQFVDLQKCTVNNIGCFQYCTDTCFRSVRYEVDPSFPIHLLNVCERDDPSNCVMVSGYYRTDGVTWLGRSRAFTAHLPVGHYDASFVDRSGNVMRPPFIFDYEPEHLCSSGETPHIIDLFVPQSDMNGNCTQLIRNGDIEATETLRPKIDWLGRYGRMELSRGQGVEGTNALVGLAGDDKRIMIVQYLDSRCLDLMKGKTFIVSALVKVVTSAKGSIDKCNPDQGLFDCPVAGVFTSNDGLVELAQVTSGTEQVGTFYKLEASMVIADSMITSQSVFFYVQMKSASQMTQLLVDSVSMSLQSGDSATSTCANLIKNSSFELGVDEWIKSGYFDSLTIQSTSAFSKDSGSVMRYNSFPLFYNGPTYRSDLYIQPFIECLTPGSHWVVEARMQLVSRITGNGVTCITYFSCPTISIKVTDGRGLVVLSNTVRHTDSLFWNTNNDTLLRSAISIPEEWDGQIGSVNVDIRYWNVFAYLIVDDFTIQPV